MKIYKNFIKEDSRSDNKLARKVFSKFPSNHKIRINKLNKEFGKLLYDDSPEALMSHQYGSFSPLENKLIDHASMIANAVFKNNKDLESMLNPLDRYNNSLSKDNFIINLWDLV